MKVQTWPEYPASRTWLLRALTAASVIGMAVAFYLSLFYVGMDAKQGNVQRIFYMHVGAFTGGTTAFFITVVAGIAYLITRKTAWDRLAVSSVEIGLPLMTITLVTGMIWAKPIWNTWWTNDARLNSMAVMWLLYAAYLTLRGAIVSPDRRARFAAVYGILAFVSVIYTTIVIRLNTASTLHPVVIGPGPDNPLAKGGFEVRTDPRMTITLAVGSIAWMLAACTLIWYRLRLENVAERLQILKMRLLNQ
jgi:heme exporter protein C